MPRRTPLHEQTSAAGAVHVEECGWLTPAHYGDAEAEYRAARTGAVIVDDSSRGKIEVRGADAARFLHNLTTNDILNLAPGAGCEAYLTTNKAKIIAHVLIFRAASPTDPPRFDLDVAPGLADVVMAHLDRYLISEQVEMDNHAPTLARMHLAGPGAAELLPQGCTINSAFRLGVPGHDLICPAEQAARIWQGLIQKGARPAGRDACEILRIEAGLPRQGADFDETTFAPEIGRIAETICYTKGCYLGQESIVMARDRGQLNRTLVGVGLPAGPVARGSLLFAEGKEVGRVTSSVRSPRLGTALGLAYVRRGHQQPGTALEVEYEGKRSLAVVVRLPV